VRWPREEVLAAVRDWHTRGGAPPALREWRRAGPTHPSAATVQRIFGSWNAAIEEAGFEPREPSLAAVPRNVTHNRCERTGRWLPGSRLGATG
jgi:hypothetical protein